VGADRVNDINDDQLRVIRTLLGTLLLIRQPADVRRGLWQSEEIRPAATARKRLRRAGAEHPDAPVRYITLRQSIRPGPRRRRWGPGHRWPRLPPPVVRTPPPAHVYRPGRPERLLP
jgi:hypothetical protein